MKNQEMNKREIEFNGMMASIMQNMKEADSLEQWHDCLKEIQAAYAFLLKMVRDDAESNLPSAGVLHTWLNDMPEEVTGWGRNWSETLFNTTLVSYAHVRASQFDTLQALDVVIRVTNGIK